ncbi:hypothetical protein SGLAM104S_05111 [Streptomyces glaucescens]
MHADLDAGGGPEVADGLQHEEGVRRGGASTATLPVEVLMKSAPASMPSQLARRMLSYVDSSPVSKMTFRRASVPQASFTAVISSYTFMIPPRRGTPRGR